MAEVYRNEGNDEYSRKNFNSAISYYTEGIKVNCKDKELKANLYSDRLAAHFSLGKKLLLDIFNFPFFSHPKIFLSCNRGGSRKFRMWGQDIPSNFIENSFDQK